VPEHRAILFDLGGTLLHLNAGLFEKTIQLHAPGYVTPGDFRRRDILAKAAITPLVADEALLNGYFRLLVELLGCPTEICGDVADALLSRYSPRELWSEPDPSAGLVLEQLARTYKLGVISNNAGYSRDELQDAGLPSYFEVIVESAEFGISKPDPRIFRHAAGTFGFPPEQCVYVGDLLHWDALGARAVGMRPILVNCSPADRIAAEQAGGIVLVERLLDVVGVLE
jgi:putative hydrolase of the HAD superfamily